MNLKNKIINKILNSKKSLRLDKFINELLFKKDSYYLSSSPIGSQNDYITSPEISQMFGEILGIYLINYWQSKIKSKFNLIELGPGKGTLLKDIFRVSKVNADFLKHSKIILIDKNSLLIKEQKKLVKQLNINNITWKKDFKISSNLPSIIYSNEFFDCFPVRQFYKKKYWLEKFVDYNYLEKNFYFIDKKVSSKKMLNDLTEFENEKLAEISTSRKKYFNKICKHIYKNKGLLLMADYGYDSKLRNFSLQCVNQHKRSHLFENIGTQDVSALVNFKELIKIAEDNNLNIDIFCTQKDFLIRHGIKEREKILTQKLKFKDKINIKNQFNRLVNDKHMGNQFKFLIVSN